MSSLLRRSRPFKGQAVLKSFVRFNSAETLVSSDSQIAKYNAHLQEYFDYYNTPKNLRPFVYRPKNHADIVRYELVDKKGERLKPRQFPGVPSKKLLSQMISLIENEQELDRVISIFKEFYRKNLDYISNNHIVELLNKSAELNLFSKTILNIYGTSREKVIGYESKEKLKFLDADETLIRGIGYLQFLKFNYIPQEQRNYAAINKRFNSLIQLYASNTKIFLDYTYNLIKLATFLPNYNPTQNEEQNSFCREKINKLVTRFNSNGFTKDSHISRSSTLEGKSEEYKLTYYQKNLTQFRIFKAAQDVLQAIPAETKSQFDLKNLEEQVEKDLKPWLSLVDELKLSGEWNKLKNMARFDPATVEQLSEETEAEEESK